MRPPDPGASRTRWSRRLAALGAVCGGPARAMAHIARATGRRRAAPHASAWAGHGPWYAEWPAFALFAGTAALARRAALTTALAVAAAARRRTPDALRFAAAAGLQAALLAECARRARVIG